MAHDLSPDEAEKLRQDRSRVQRDFWRKLKATFRKVPFIDDLTAIYYCAMDPTTPLRVKGILFGALAYFVVPTDLVPDFIAGLGFVDDAGVLYAAVKTVLPHIKPEHRASAKEALDRMLQETV